MRSCLGICETEGLLHGESRGRLWSHLAMQWSSGIPGEVLFLGHRALLLKLRLLHPHKEFAACRVRCGRSRSHEIHQEFRVAVVARRVGTHRALARYSLVMTDEILEKLVGTSLWLRPRSEYLLDMLRRWSSNRTIPSFASVLLERLW